MLGWKQVIWPMELYTHESWHLWFRSISETVTYCRCNMHICSWNHMVQKYHGLIQEGLTSPVHRMWNLLRICLILVVSMFMWPNPCLGSQWSGIPKFFCFPLFAELWTTISSKPSFCFSHIRKVLNLGGFCIPQSNMSPSSPSNEQ